MLLADEEIARVKNTAVTPNHHVKTSRSRAFSRKRAAPPPAYRQLLGLGPAEAGCHLRARDLVSQHARPRAAAGPPVAIFLAMVYPSLGCIESRT